MTLAYDLGRTIDEIENMSPDEYSSWVAYFQILSEERKKEANRARSKRKG